MNTIRLAVLGATRGTVMQYLMEAINAGQLDAKITVVVSSKADAYILERAKQGHIPHYFVDSEGISAEQHQEKISQILQRYQPDLIILIGYMRILLPNFIQQWRGNIINVHPSLLPKHAGLIGHAVHKSVLARQETESGCTIHYVTEKLDAGPIIVQRRCAVTATDNTESLKQKVQKLEGEAYVIAIKQIQSQRKTVMNKQIMMPRTALISVSDKTGILEFAQTLMSLNVRIISTGGTAKHLRQQNVPVTEVADITHFPEMMEGRIKTLHPTIFGGILGKRDQHAEQVKQHHIPWIDLVICNLYPFAQTIQKSDTTFDHAIENIDIGGPSMLRAAAKNMAWVCVISDHADYKHISNELQQQQGICFDTRKQLAAKAFAHTAQYDSLIQQYLEVQAFPQALNLSYEKVSKLRYGENPHQQAAVYRPINCPPFGILASVQRQGKPLSYNNILDSDAALNTISEFQKPACVVVKHNTPCGVAVADHINEAFERAWAGDSKSAFGGIVILNRPCSAKIAEFLATVFIEVLIAPTLPTEALKPLSKKANIRLLELSDLSQPSQNRQLKSITGGLLLQDGDNQALAIDDCRLVTKQTLSERDSQDMLFAWQVVKHIKSNAILIVKQQRTLGVGAGQVSRVDAVEIAITKADNCQGAVLASDAFFPFRDSIDRIAQAGIRAIIQPGGSIRDPEVIAACDEHGIAMLFTAKRCFKH